VIKARVAAFMKDLNEELWKMGIMAKTQHNEVAPAQHEIVPIFSTANIAADHNQLIMDGLKKVAAEHNFACLLHEKPFKGLSGSGKHNNYSLATDIHKNLLTVGKTPKEQERFLLIFAAILAAVNKYADLVRISAASAGNEARMGSHEAPPNIISVYIGEDMQALLDDFLEGNAHGVNRQILNGGFASQLEIYKDASDRNRTSPFAFTGNKFEFRMVGSSATLSSPNTTINTIVADSFRQISERLEAGGIDAAGLIRELYGDSKKIIFNGNNYSEEWAKEAKKRGLSNLDNCVDCYNLLVINKHIELFERMGVYTAAELRIRREIFLDTYVKTVSTEALTMLTLTARRILPAVLKRQSDLAHAVYELRAANPQLVEVPLAELKNLTALLAEIKTASDALNLVLQTAKNVADIAKRAVLMRDKITPAMNALRKAVDNAEAVMPHAEWPLACYADMLFYS
jgi:glutamine synthetase